LEVGTRIIAKTAKKRLISTKLKGNLMFEKDRPSAFTVADVRTD